MRLAVAAAVLGFASAFVVLPPQVYSGLRIALRSRVSGVEFLQGVARAKSVRFNPAAGGRGKRRVQKRSASAPAGLSIGARSTCFAVVAVFAFVCRRAATWLCPVGAGARKRQPCAGRVLLRLPAHLLPRRRGLAHTGSAWCAGASRPCDRETDAQRGDRCLWQLTAIYEEHLPYGEDVKVLDMMTCPPRPSSHACLHAQRTCLKTVRRRARWRVRVLSIPVQYTKSA